MKAAMWAHFQRDRALLWPYIAPVLAIAVDTGAKELGAWHPSSEVAVGVALALSLAAKALVVKLRAVPPPTG